MHQNYVVYITGGIWPLDNGARLHSYGLCREFSKVIPLKIFSFAGDSEQCYKECNLVGSEELRFHAMIPCDKSYEWSFQMIAMLTCSNYLYADWIKQIEDTINKEECKAVVIDQISTYSYYAYLKKKYPNKKYIYISHNVEYINLFEKYFLRNGQFYIKPTKEYLKRILFYRARKAAEKDIINHADYIFSISPDDIEQFNKIFKPNGEMIFAKPMIEFPAVKEQKDIEYYHFNVVFIGSMYWYPNINGIKWFVNEVFGKLIAHNDNYKLFIVGRNPSSDIYQLKDKYPKNIIVTGEVEDVKEYYKLGDVSIVPLFEGMGTKIKVLESIASGIPTVCTSFAANAYRIKDELLISDDADSFYEAIISIEQDKEKRKQLFASMRYYYKNYMQIDADVENVLKRSVE